MHQWTGTRRLSTINKAENELYFCVLHPPGDVTQSCDITAEPVSRRQRLLTESVEVCLKGVLQGWDASSLMQAFTESWVLQSSNSSVERAVAFQRLLMELSAHALHMVRQVMLKLMYLR